MRGLGGKIVGAARIINTDFVKKKNIIPSPLMKKDPVQFHRFFLFFLWAKKERQIQKNILTGNGNRTYGESRDRDDRLRGTTV